MTDNGSLIIGGIDLSSVYNTAMNESGRAEPEHFFKKPCNLFGLMEMLLKLRLARWKSSVIVATKQSSSMSIGTATDGERAKELLDRIASAIRSKEELASEDELRYTEPDIDYTAIEHLPIYDKVKEMVERYQKQGGAPAKVHWAMKNEKRYRLLIDKLSRYIAELESLLPVADQVKVADDINDLARAEVEELVQGTMATVPGEDESALLNFLLEVARHIKDPVLKRAVKDLRRLVNSKKSTAGNQIEGPDFTGVPPPSFEILAEDKATDGLESTTASGQGRSVKPSTSKHSYRGNKTKDRAKSQKGDRVASGVDPASVARNPGHSYTNNEASGESTTLYGDEYLAPGSKGFFDE